MMNNLEFQFTDGLHLPVGTMFCIGRNYANHARELGNELPENPIVFLKPPTAYVNSGGTVKIPSFSTNMHHEVEAVIVIGKDGRDIPKDEAKNHIAGYAVGIDFTLRDIQNFAKQKGEPWAVAKGFFSSAPISSVIPVSQFENVPFLDISLEVNGVIKQSGNTKDMERTVEELISYVSSVFGIRKGDCIFTGTPEGVGQVYSGDLIQCSINNQSMLIVTIM